MKIQLPCKLMLGALLLVGSRSAIRAQNYTIDWYKVAGGGGGGSTGGVYSASGTIGQPDAGSAITGGNYSLSGGYWALFAVQAPGSPLLKIILTSSNTAVVSWPAPSTGFNLQQNTDLSTTNWAAPAETITTNGTVNQIIVSPPTGKRFYRLKN